MKKCAECVTVDLLFILFTLGGVDKLCERNPCKQHHKTHYNMANGEGEGSSWYRLW